MTGGAGFVGSFVVDQLVVRGHSVRVLDSLSKDAHNGEPDYLNRDVEYLWGDVTDPRAAAKAVTGVDAVCHQAARVGLGVDFGDVTSYVRDNDTGTAVLLQALYRRGFQVRLVLASSMVVYGEGLYECPEHGELRPPPRRTDDLDRGLFEPRCPRCRAELSPLSVEESCTLDPRNVYAATKVHQEHLCENFARETGSVSVALRYHNVYGPRMPRDTPYAGVASIFRSALAAGLAPQVFEDGRQRRDFVHVSDVATANVLALEADDEVNGAFNVASGEVRTVREMAEALRGAFGERAAAPVVNGRYRSGDVRHLTATPRRAETLLGFKALNTFSCGMLEFATAPLRSAI